MGSGVAPNKESSLRYKAIYENYEKLAKDMVKFF